jgi:integrase/recombinase XerD
VHVLRSWVVGPLEPFAEGFAGELARRGYTVRAAGVQVGLVAHLSRWMAEHGLDVGDLTSMVVEEYVAARSAAGYRNLFSIKALAPLLEYLLLCGALPAPEAVSARTPIEILVDNYCDYLVSERGLRPKVVRGYLDLVRPFIDHAVRGGELSDLVCQWPVISPRGWSVVFPAGGQVFSPSAAR